MAIFPGSAIPSAAGGYTINQSMYFGDAPNSSPRLSRAFDEAGSTSPKWTFATWWKKGSPVSSAKVLYYFRPLTVHTGADVTFSHTNDTPGAGAGLQWNCWPGVYNPSITWDWSTSDELQFRDYSAWYHICHVVDYETSPYVFLYINGVLQDIDTIYGTKSGAGYGTNFSPVSGDTFFIGSNYSEQCGNAYFADTYWIEQQALTPVDTFGEFDEDTGQFVPIKYTGTYSGNSFYLNYSDSADFGADSSGLSNDFTVASIAAGKSRPDTPTNNFCTINPLNDGSNTSSTGVLKEGNLYFYSWVSGDGYWDAYGTFLMTTGKWYFEVEVVNNASDSFFGICDPQNIVDTVYPMSNDGTCAWNPITAAPYMRLDGSDTTYGTQTKASNGDILGIAIDLDGETFEGFVNNVSQGSFDFSSRTVGSGSVALIMVGYSWTGNVSTYVLNCGQDSSFAGEKTAQGNQDGNGKGDFYYEPPSGYLALCTDNLSDPEIALPGENFNTVLYAGNAGSNHAITGVGFQSDFTWIKVRGTTDNHFLTDSVRSNRYGLSSNTTAAANSKGADVFDSFDSDGFTVTHDPTYDLVNRTSQNYVAWNWKAGGTAVSNGDGSVTTSVSANPAAGFSIVSYTGTGSSATFGHGLSQAPQISFYKVRSEAYQWMVYTGNIISSTGLILNGTDAGYSPGGTYGTHGASTFNLLTNADVNGSTKTYISYHFHSVEGYSKVGSYEGNGNLDGTFVYTGFRPAFVMTKSVDSTSDWQMFDNKRTGYNVDNYELEANDNAAEDTTTEFIDIVSNGFKNRDTTDPNVAETYIYLAFAESPFKYANAR